MACFGILLESAGGSGEPVDGLASASRGHARPWPWPGAASRGRSSSWEACHGGAHTQKQPVRARMASRSGGGCGGE